MEFRALGSLEVIVDGVPVELTSPKVRALLALLLINKDHVVTVDRISDALWGDDASGKENALWVLISRLRSTLEPSRMARDEGTAVITRGAGYQLTVEPDRYDVACFDRLVEAGRASAVRDPVEASKVLAEALALWRGPAFDDVRYEQFAQVEIARLEEERLTVLEDRIDADLACGRDGDLVGELEGLCRAHPLRERVRASLMLSLYRSGRAADALRAFAEFRAMLAEETGLDPSPGLRRLEEQILLHDERIRRPLLLRTGEPRPAIINPFRGLRSFGEADAPWFFGRDRLIAEILRTLRTGQRLVTLIGASGAGKSSIISAGLVPALRHQAIEGSGDWLIAQMVPGAHPFAEFEAALLRVADDAPASLSEQLTDPQDGILRAVLRVLPDGASKLVLVIDQFEELFSMADSDVRTRFLDGLVLALDDHLHRLTVVATLRADFYSHVLTHPAMGARVGNGVVNITALTEDELEQAATRPLDAVGVAIEPALLRQLVNDVGRAPGALPLFQFTLTDLFDRRIDDQMVLSVYRSMGGVDGALRRRTDELFERLSPQQQEAAKQLFLRMVTITETGDRARRRVSASEILALGVDAVAMQVVIDQFGQHRLLTFDADPLTGAPNVEVAHEALLTAWDRLATWIDAARADLRRHAALAVAMNEWILSNRNVDYLLSGARLDEYENWAAATSMALTDDEREFLSASSSDAIARRRQDDDRRAHEAVLDRRARHRFWSATVAVAAFAALVAAVVVVRWNNNAPPTVGLFVNTGDRAYGDNIAAGMQRVDNERDIDLSVIALTIEPVDQFTDIARSGLDLVITDPTPFNGETRPAAIIDNPQTQFGVIDQLVDAPNAASIVFASEQGAFLVGVAAALRSQTGTVGFVGSMPTIPELPTFQAGFEAGARWADPNVTVLSTYIEPPMWGNLTYQLNTFKRQDLAERRATELYERGADVVFHAAGQAGFGVFDAAANLSEELGTQLWAIGVDNDQWYQVDARRRDHVLTSMIKRADLATYLLATDYLDGTLESGTRELTLADDAIDYSTQGVGMTAEIIASVEAAKAAILDGSIVVPTQPAYQPLDLDPLPAGFSSLTDRFSDVELNEYAMWLRAGYAAEYDSECWTGTRQSCGQLLLDRIDDWSGPAG